MWFELEKTDSFFGYRGSTGQWRDIVAVSALLPEWHPRGIYAVVRGISLIEFERGTEKATWFVDENLERIAGSIRELRDDAREQLLGTYRPVIDEIYESVLVKRIDAIDRTGLLNVNQLTRTELSQACFPVGQRPVVENVVDTRCTFKYMAECLHKDFQEAIIVGADLGCIQLIDPSDGLPAHVRHGIALDDFRAIYLLKSRNGHDLWVCVSGHYASIVGVYDLAEDKFYVVSAHNASDVVGSFGSLRSELRHLAAAFGDVLPPYLKASDPQIASFLRPPPANHLGHQLWNELTGIQLAVNRLTRDTIPTIVVPSADRGTEAFGPTEHIFPELYRRIVRWPSELDFRRHAIISGLTLVRLSQRKVTAELRARINVRVNSISELQGDHDTLSSLVTQKRRIIVLGLRVENRTIDDLKSFVSNFVALCAETVPGSVVVIDGHNSQKGSAGEKLLLASHGQWGAKRQPIEVEMELARYAVETAEELDIEVLDLIGESVERSLFWSLHADCFVTIWGAGLAKYRWVANRPGYVITSAWNRNNRPDLHIYSSDQFMESPAVMDFVPAEEIEDLANAEQLVSFQSDQQPESYYNFAIKDHQRLGFLKAYLSSLDHKHI